MSAKDMFHVYLRSLPTRPIEFRVSGDGNAFLHITADVVLYVRPAEDDLPAVIAGLRKLAAAAGEMAEALSSHAAVRDA